MIRITRALAGAALAAASMYWFDPASGRRRRAHLRERLGHLAADLGDGVGTAARDLQHRLRGFGARTRSRFGTSDAIDEVIIERVRSALGRAISHPRAITVTCVGGWVTLSGAVLAHEHTQLLRVVRSVRGVEHVTDDLSVHLRAAGIPSLQGGQTPRPSRFEFMQENWSPAARLVAGGTGTALVFLGARQLFGPHRHVVLGAASALAGGLLLVRTSENAPLRRLAATASRGAIDIRKILHVEAPIDKVFGMLAHYQNFPAFMRNVRDVRMHEDGRSHWVVAGPAGMSVEWDAETTAYEPNELLAWRTVANASVKHAGIIRFERDRSGTRLDVQMSYRPPAGAFGHVVAKLFGADPKKELDEDLMRLKSFLETGVPARDAARAGEPIPTLQPSTPGAREAH